MDKKSAHRKAELSYVRSLEADLEEAGRLLRLANPENRHWREKRDQFLEKLGYPMEPPNE